jgi:hypothetical protein
VTDEIARSLVLAFTALSLMAGVIIGLAFHKES